MKSTLFLTYSVSSNSSASPIVLCLGEHHIKNTKNILFPVGCQSKYPYRCKSATQLYDKVAFQVLRVHTCPTCTDHAAEAGKVQGTGTEQSHVLGREDLHGP